mgnify:CR=1 FL=1
MPRMYGKGVLIYSCYDEDKLTVKHMLSREIYSDFKDELNVSHLSPEQIWKYYNLSKYNTNIN